MAQTHSLDLESSSSQYASISDASQTGLDITGDFTIEGWIKIESSPASNTFYAIFNKGDATGTDGGYGFEYGNASGTLRLRAYWYNAPSNFSRVYKDITLNTGTWYHVACTVNVGTASGSTIYVNGLNYSVTVEASSATSINNNSKDAQIGISKDGQYFDGLLKDVRVFSNIRSQSEIIADAYTENVSDANLQGEWNFNNAYTDSSGNGNTLTASGSPVFSTNIPWENATQISGSTYLDTDLVAYWSMDESSGNALDSVGSRDLTNNNTVTYVSGKIENAAQFNGTNQSLTRSTETLGIANSWGIRTWVKFDTEDDAQQIIEFKQNSGDNNRIALNRQADNTLIVTLVNSSVTGYKQYYGNTELLSGIYYQIIVTYNGIVLDLYINNIFQTVTKTLDQAVTQTDTSRNIRLATYDGGGDLLDGEMDETCYYSRYLHFGDVLDLYSNGSGIPYEVTTGGANSGFFNFM